MKADISIVATGDKWIGYGTETFAGALERLLTSAKREIIATLYLVSDFDVLDLIQGALRRGVAVKLFVNGSKSMTDPKFKTGLIELEKLSERFKKLEIEAIRQDILHAKVLVVDYEWTLVGSANLTFSGMSVNYELGILIHSEEAAWRIANLVNRIGEQK